MRTETLAVVTELERLSGYAVQVIPVQGLTVMAKVTSSPKATGSYVVQYRAGISFKDYLVAFQCGHVLRLLSLPASERFQFATLSAATEWGARLVRAFWKSSGRSTPPDSVLATVTEQLVLGLFTQLRSIPIGMRIDAWLAADYRALADQQTEALAAQQEEALACLSPQIRAMVPDEIVSASILLNTAYALFCDRLLGARQYHVPYAASGFKDLGEALLEIFDELPPAPSSDRTLIDRWAREIGLDGKYTWVPAASATSSASS